MTNRIVQLTCAVVVAVSLGGSAVAGPCEAKTVEGHIALAHAQGSGAVGYFELQDCSWGEVPALNGTDGLVLSTKDMEGNTGSVTGTLVPGSSVFYVNLEGYFLDEDCGPVQDAELDFRTSLESAPKSFPLSIPPNARWLVISGARAGATNDVTVTLHSDGRDCSVPLRKKKRRR